MSREDRPNGGRRTQTYEEEGARDRRIPQEILDIIMPALQIGGVAGISGTIIGGFGGVIRSKTPIIFALASGIQWFTLGTSFYASRSAILHSWTKQKPSQEITPSDKIKASALAGSTAGAFGGLLRGPKNIIPGILMFTLFGATGQYIFNVRSARQPDEEQPNNHSWLNSRWSPMKVLSDTEYDEMLQEKLLKVNAQIAIIDENIAALREEEVKDREDGGLKSDVKATK
ncbi:hypothetical protein GLAREA_11306 [Glarea lozoyensis ATCC 20868]|uniref:Uncharacterized protein n=1 Tax=Glarea lozoyensis (strain ATCC 20868 / MF5171) TaxID=1116229 RepID=S3DUG6_GLAL2|nr:uncharacterized protein GLAREA_11306 [Glarea lozoyensis ATCC 20868]EPE35606.1 hypothetical protein GLAREA_11306 [Glarea lozoyensis ATCC 20868]